MKNLILIIVVICFTGCKATAEQKAERKALRISKRATADSLYLVQQKAYLIEQQGQNFPESQDQDNDH